MASRLIGRRSSGAQADNSFDGFARSWQRAAYFHEVMPRNSFIFTEPEDEEDGNGVDDYILPRENDRFTHSSTKDTLPHPASGEGEDIVSEDQISGWPSNGQIAVDSLERYVTEMPYGTEPSRMSESTKLRAERLHQEHRFFDNRKPDDEREPLLLRNVHRENGTKESVIVGKSTVPQTIFNSINVLIGIGLLSLPLGLRYAGWLIGISFLIFSAIVTAYTAKILAKCMGVDSTLVTYADLAYISFGPRARVLTSLLFCLELIGACVALVVLFADSVDALIPGLGTLWWKLICGAVLLPLNFVPLRLLSVTSFLGIFCCTSSMFATQPFHPFTNCLNSF